MAKRNVMDVAKQAMAPAGDGADGPTFEEKVEQHEYAIDNADREKIDQIVLSQDVQKGGKIRIERKGPIDRDFQYVTTMPAEGWDTEQTFEWIKKMYGGGDYKCQSFRANGQMYKPFAFSIDHRVKGKLDDDEITRLANSSKMDGLASKVIDAMRVTPDQGALKGADLIRVMEMGNNRSSEMMTLIMTMMMKSQETMSTVLAAAISAGNRGGASIDPVLVELLKAKQDRPPMMEVLEIMRAVKELNEDNRTDEPKEQDMWDKIMKVASVAIPALQMGQQSPPTMQVQPGQPQPQISPPAHPQQPGMIGQLPLGMQLGIASLLRAAERGSDPSLYADLVLDQLVNEQQAMMLKAILTDPGWKSKLWGDEGKVLHIGPWLDEFRRLILSTYEPAPATDVSGPAGPGGAGADAQPGAGPGANPPIS